MKRLIFLASAIIAATIIAVVIIFLRIYRIPLFYVEILGISNSAVHWIGWIGTLFIAFVTPAYPIIKRRFPTRLRPMLSVHVIGNLTAVMLVSIHFAHQVTRSATNYPVLGTGVVLYATMILLVSTGFYTLFGLRMPFSKKLKFLHPALAITFYLTIIMHIIHGI